MDKERDERMLRLLSRDALRDNLGKAALFILAYELLEDSIVERPKSFFTMGGLLPDDEGYEREILSKIPRKKKGKQKERDGGGLLQASCRWFQDQGCLTGRDVAEINELRSFRNRLAHEMPNVILSPHECLNDGQIERILELVSKVDRWWFENFEPLSPGFRMAPTDYASGSMLFIEYALKVLGAGGQDPRLGLDQPLPN